MLNNSSIQLKKVDSDFGVTSPLNFVNVETTDCKTKISKAAKNVFQETIYEPGKRQSIKEAPSVVTDSEIKSKSLQKQEVIEKKATMSVHHTEYQALFLDDWQRLMLAGKTEEARLYAEKKEEECITALNKRYDVNTTLIHRNYRQSQHRKYYEKNEQITFESLRVLYKSLEGAKLSIQNNINQLKAAFEEREKAIQNFLDKEKNGPLLREEIEKKLQELKVKKAHIESDIISLSLKEGGLSSRHYQYLTDLLESFIWSISDEQKQFEQTPPDARLKTYELNILNGMKDNFLAFKEDTVRQIEKEKAKLKFIEKYPDFFVINPKSRAELLSAKFLDNLDYAPICLGDAVHVGVVDIFTNSTQSSSIMKKVINPEFQGTGAFAGVDNEENPSHGLHVAGIIASDEYIPSQNYGEEETIGIAPNAYLELWDSKKIYDDTNNRGMCPREKADHLAQWDVCYTVQYLNALDTYYKKNSFDEVRTSLSNISPLKPFFDRTSLISQAREQYYQPTAVSNGVLKKIKESSFVNSSARIFNFSISASTLKRFSRRSLLSPETDLFQLAHYKLAIDAGKLLVFALGNDSINISTTEQYRTLKALASAHCTREGFITVVNLCKDGLTIHPSSNQPGRDKDLQDIGLKNRTISALGTQIYSTLSNKDEEGKERELSYAQYTGTSMAAPQVSGAAAIVLSNYPELTNAQLSNAILKGATPIMLDKDGNPYEVTEMLAGDLENNSKFSIEEVELARGKYGMGRLNLSGALYWASKTLNKAEVVRPRLA